MLESANPVGSASNQDSEPPVPPHLHCCDLHLSGQHLWPGLGQQPPTESLLPSPPTCHVALRRSLSVQGSLSLLGSNPSMGFLPPRKSPSFLGPTRPSGLVPSPLHSFLLAGLKHSGHMLPWGLTADVAPLSSLPVVCLHSPLPHLLQVVPQMSPSQ